MNTRYNNCIHVVAVLSEVGADEKYIGNRIVGVSVKKAANGTGVVTLDINDYNKPDKNLMVEIELAELVSAVSLATLNSEKE